MAQGRERDRLVEEAEQAAGAEHGEQPHVTTISEEVESDRSTAAYGEQDAVGHADQDDL